MKKIVLLILIIFLTGCTKEMTCTINVDNDKYTFDAEYKIYYKSKYVTKIVKKEKYYTKDLDTYKLLKESKKLEYGMMSDSYGGYDYKIENNRPEIKIKATVNVKKLDVEKLVSDKVIDKYYTSKKEILVSGLKKHYESKSAVCK